MKRILAFALVLTLVFALCVSPAASAAGPNPGVHTAPVQESPAPAAPAEEAPAPAEEAPAPAEEAQPEAESSTADPIGEQLTFIAGQFKDLRQSDDDGVWYYAVTDLDHNGRLELLANRSGGTGPSTLKAWEVSPNGSSMIVSTMQTIPAPVGSKEQDLHVDSMMLNLLNNSVDTYYDKEANVYYYCVVDAMETHRFIIPGEKADEVTWVDGNGSAVMTGVHAVSMKNGSIDPGFILGSCVSYVIGDGDLQVVCRNGKGEKISMDAFLDIEKTTFADLPSFNTAFDWFAAAEASTLGRFVDSYATFDGVRDPDRPESGISLLGSQSYGGVYITKNPTDEKHNDGETAEFIANANIYDTVTWTFIAPDGRTCNEQEFVKMCGGIPQGTNTGYLKIKNVNTDMNGWGVFATFDYRGASARSTTAYLYVWGSSGSSTQMGSFYDTRPYQNGGGWTCPMCGSWAYGSQCNSCGFNPVAYYATYQNATPDSYGWYYGVDNQTPISSISYGPISASFSWDCPNCGTYNEDVVYCRRCSYHYGDPVAYDNVAINTAREAAMGADLRICQYCGNYFNSDYDVCPYCYNAPNDGTYYDPTQWNQVQEMYQGATMRTCQYCGNYFNSDYDVCPYCNGAPDDSYYGGYANNYGYDYGYGYNYDYAYDGAFAGYTPGGNEMYTHYDYEGNSYNTVICPICGYEHSMATNCPNCGAGYG